MKNLIFIVCLFTSIINGQNSQDNQKEQDRLYAKAKNFLDEGLFTEIFNQKNKWDCVSGLSVSEVETKISQLTVIKRDWEKPYGDIATYKSNLKNYNDYMLKTVGSDYYGKLGDRTSEIIGVWQRKYDNLNQCLQRLRNDSSNGSQTSPKSNSSNQTSNSNNSNYSGYQPKSETQIRNEINNNVDNLTNSISSIFALSAENRRRSEERAKRIRQQEKATYNSSRDAYFENLNTIKKAKSLRKAKYTISEEEQKLYQYILQNPSIENFNYYLSSNLEYYRSEIEFFEYLFLIDKFQLTDGNISYGTVSIVNGVDMGYPSIRRSNQSPIIRFSDRAKIYYKNIYIGLLTKQKRTYLIIDMPKKNNNISAAVYMNELDIISKVPTITNITFEDAQEGKWITQDLMECKNVKSISFSPRYKQSWLNIDVNYDNLEKLSFIETLTFGKGVKIPMDKIVKMPSIKKINIVYTNSNRKSLLKALQKKFKEVGIKTKLYHRNSKTLSTLTIL